MKRWFAVVWRQDAYLRNKDRYDKCGKTAIADSREQPPISGFLLVTKISSKKTKMFVKNCSKNYNNDFKNNVLNIDVKCFFDDKFWQRPIILIVETVNLNTFKNVNNLKTKFLFLIFQRKLKAVSWFCKI